MWLPLNEYAHRTGVSLSTLRRRIKSNGIKFKLESGKYFIWSDGGAEEPVENPSPVERPSGGEVEHWRALCLEKDKRINLLEVHIRHLHQEIEALQSLVKVLEAAEA